MRIIQITDLHVADVGVKVKGEEDTDTRANLFLVIQHLISLKYDLVTITGDFCLTTPKKQIYQWIFDELSATINMKLVRVIGGNHDHTPMMASIFCPERILEGDELYYKESFEDRPLFFLDTAKGFCSEEQKNWFKKELTESPSNDPVIFMHHPPVISGVHYMDTSYALKDMNDFQAIFSEFPAKRFQIFCGHYHVDRVVNEANMTVHITPSCYVQIDPNATTFVPMHYDIGYRIIDLLPNNKLITEVCYIL